MPAAPRFRRVAVLGTGLVGGSFALTLRAANSHAHIVGWDRPDALARGVARGAINEAAADLVSAVRDADLIYIALPVRAAIESLPEIAAFAAPAALVTDACSTKSAIVAAATRFFRAGARFLGGHPIAGKEVCGVENASADLFRGARYVLTTTESDSDPRVAALVDLLRSIGARPVFCDPDVHDWALGIVSHLPQLVSVALARVVLDETDETGLPVSLAGTGLRDATRLAGSSIEVWRDVCLTNSENIARALDRAIQALDHLRRNLSTRALDGEFRAANELYEMLRQLQ